MGIIRLLLAISVVLAHSAPIAGYFGIPSHAAVTLFFVISGFYMGLIATEKYIGENHFRAFYSNRLLRLYPTYLIALLLAVGVRLWLDSHHITKGITDEPHFFPVGMPWSSRLLLLVPNVTLFGSDLTFLFHYGVDSGWHFTLGQDASGFVDAHRTGRYLLIPPAWSIGIELWFYLLVPFLVRWKTLTLSLSALVSLSLRFGMEYHEAWSSYFFFPANLGFFLIGILAYRAYRSAAYRNFANPKRAALVFGMVLALLVFRQYVPFYRNYPWQMYFIFAISLPFLFDASKRWRVDRWIGNLSYPIYIIHAPVLLVLEEFQGVESERGAVAVVITLGLAVMLLIFVDQPLDRIRQKRLKGRMNFTETKCA
jgi:peptidoglycan/LPS O-acetylase OafA/YrhL